MFCVSTVLPVRGCATIRARSFLAERRDARFACHLTSQRIRFQSAPRMPTGAHKSGLCVRCAVTEDEVHGAPRMHLDGAPERRTGALRIRVGAYS